MAWSKERRGLALELLSKATAWPWSMAFRRTLLNGKNQVFQSLDNRSNVENDTRFVAAAPRLLSEAIAEIDRLEALTVRLANHRCLNKAQQACLAQTLWPEDVDTGDFCDEATHSCKVCGAPWKKNPPDANAPEGSWMSEETWTPLAPDVSGVCCYGSEIGDQMKPVTR